ncbi:LapA family protein [Rhizobium sp. YJ-22]|uniref:LapA family protein n=1 Tax=Rhizobium sp. YJ-22 TaxID=3037556 RepID=UPI002412CCD4|nr:LapA family protein [Rhizobium sp. YJ-22]MDG3575390.1 LapA family protein [Rhizobium sp. YJ-22]
MVKKIVNLVIFLPLAVVLVLLCVANRQSVTLALNPFRPEDQVLGLSAPFFVFLFLALILGLVIGASVTWATQGQHRRRARTEAKTAVRLQAEADKHKARAEELAAQQTVAYGRLPAK